MGGRELEEKKKKDEEFEAKREEERLARGQELKDQINAVKEAKQKEIDERKKKEEEEAKKDLIPKGGKTTILKNQTEHPLITKEKKKTQLAYI